MKTYAVYGTKTTRVYASYSQIMNSPLLLGLI